MRIRVFALGLALATVLMGQGKRANWQDICFKNPAAPFCQGHDYAVKPPPAAKKDAPSKSVVNNPGFSASRPAARSTAASSTGAPAMVVVGGIDWRFADPFADALVGINFSGLSASPLARSLITQLGASQGLNGTDMQKIFDGLAGVDQVAASVRGQRMVVMITGRVTESNLPPPEAGLKLVPLAGSAILVGHAEAVDQAAQRIAMNAPLTESASLASERQTGNEFWAMGSPALAGPQALGTGMKRFSVAVSIRDRFSSDVAFEFNGAPNANILQALQKSLGSGALEGNTVHVRTSLEADQAQQTFGQIVASPLGQQLGILVQSAKYLPVPDTTHPKQTRPVIYGLDGGPRVVGQDPHQ
jgi:hypothetical protein